jgi:RNA recognition motif-containing protein
VSREEGKKVYVGNLPYKVKSNGSARNITNDDLRVFFEDQGVRVLDAITITDRDTKMPKGFGFVRVESDDFDKALAVDGVDFEGRTVKVNEAREREREGSSRR